MHQQPSAQGQMYGQPPPGAFASCAVSCLVRSANMATSWRDLKTLTSTRSHSWSCRGYFFSLRSSTRIRSRATPTAPECPAASVAATIPIWSIVKCTSTTSACNTISRCTVTQPRPACTFTVQVSSTARIFRRGTSSCSTWVQTQAGRRHCTRSKATCPKQSASTRNHIQAAIQQQKNRCSDRAWRGDCQAAQG